MRAALKLYYGRVVPTLWKQRRPGLIVALWFVFHLGPLVAKPAVQPWEQPYIYANF